MFDTICCVYFLYNIIFTNGVDKNKRKTPIDTGEGGGQIIPNTKKRSLFTINNIQSIFMGVVSKINENKCMIMR